MYHLTKQLSLALKVHLGVATAVAYTDGALFAVIVKETVMLLALVRHLNSAVGMPKSQKVCRWSKQ